MEKQPSRYIIVDHALRAARLEAQRDQIPGSFILWEAEGVELPSGRRTGPTYVLWRPVDAPLPQEPEYVEPEPETVELVNGATEELIEQTPLVEAEPPPRVSSEEAPARNKRSRVSPRHLPKTTRYKGITRIDYAPKRTYGYMVRVPWQGQIHQKFFSDKKHGDRLAALAAALEWRNNTERELGKPRTEDAVPGNSTRTSNTGVLGVTRVTSNGQDRMQVTWSVNGKMHRTSYSVRRHGVQGALKLARAARARAEREKKSRRE